MESDGGPLFESFVDLIKPPPDCNVAKELLAAFRRNSNRTILVDALSGRQWTGGQILRCCGGIATSLVRRAGLEVDDVVMTICDRNDAEILVALAVILAGGGLYPTQPMDGYNEALILCELVKPQVFLINSKYQDCALMLCKNVEGLQDAKIVCIDDLNQCDVGALAGASSGAAQLDGNNNEPESIVDGVRVYSLDGSQLRDYDEQLIDSIANERIKAAEHTFSFLLTSGSTGRPKVVPNTHEEFVWGLYSMVSATKRPIRRKAIDANNNQPEADERAEVLLKLDGDDVVAGDLPLDHGAGLNMMFLSFSLGAKYIVMPAFEVDQFWQAVSDHKITYSMASVTFGFQLFKRLRSRLEDGSSSELDLASLEKVVFCGAKLGFTDLVEEIQLHYPQMVVSQAYGATECGYIATLPAGEARAHIESVGYLFPGLRVKIVDPNDLGRRLGPEQRGELLLWTKSLFKGYRCHPEVDAEEIRRNCHDAEGLFYRTGDQAHFDSAGRLYIHGRFKDTLVLMGDWKIMPAELEAIVNEHPLVESSAVIGVPDPELEHCHRPRAFVKLVAGDKAADLVGKSAISHELNTLLKLLENDDAASLAEHIQQFVAARVAPFKQLTGGVRVLKEFPTVGILNKVDRKVLRELD